jgi:hypothetical protein
MRSGPEAAVKPGANLILSLSNEVIYGYTSNLFDH